MSGQQHTRVPEQDDIDIYAWVHEIIDGVGGMNNFERYEWAIWHVPEREAAAIWAIRCLANPKCEGADKVLAAIAERRALIAGEQG
jgi:hypothetical protein